MNRNNAAAIIEGPEAVLNFKEENHIADLHVSKHDN